VSLQQIVGSDIAELLLQSPSASEGRSDSQAPMLIDFSEGPAPDPVEPCVPGDDLLTGPPTCGASSGPQSDRRALQKYTALLLAGRKKVNDDVNYSHVTHRRLPGETFIHLYMIELLSPPQIRYTRQK